MKRTIGIKLKLTKDQSNQLESLRDEFLSGCNQIVPFAVQHRCWNRVALHNICYTALRASSPLGSQMVCNAIFSVCKAYKNKCMENLTNIRKRIRTGKKIRSRLHRWAFHQLQTLIQYKAETHGLKVLYVNPAYSSQICSLCDQLGKRDRHLFKCSCGNQQHSDLNASRNLCKFAQPIGRVTCTVNCTQVATIG